MVFFVLGRLQQSSGCTSKGVERRDSREGVWGENIRTCAIIKLRNRAVEHRYRAGSSSH